MLSLPLVATGRLSVPLIRHTRQQKQLWRLTRAASSNEVTAQVHRGVGLEQDDFSSNRHPVLSFCWSMISAQTRSAFVARENRCPLFRIMLMVRQNDSPAPPTLMMQLRRRSEAAVMPLRLGRFDQVLRQYFMDLLALGALEYPHVRTVRTRSDPGQRHAGMTLRTAWPFNRER
jgi:hypothetical protein